MNNHLKQFRNIYKKTYNQLNNDSLFFLSERNLNGNILTPQIPRNFFTENGFEDNKTRRVCFASSIDACLMSLSMECRNKEFYVHVPVGNYRIYYPTVNQVPDVQFTGEKWICEPVEVECIGKIKVENEDGIPVHIYTYGDGIEAKLFGWKWRYII